MLGFILFITALFSDTSKTDFYLSGDYGKSTMPVVGKYKTGFSVSAYTVYDIDSTNRFFGNVSYQWNMSKDNQWVENADFDLLYPYLICDTVGGDMKKEQYKFNGGYRMIKNHVIWHAALHFRAEQSYRIRDPRPKNKVAYIALSTSIGYATSHYAYSLSFSAGRYKQNSTVSFYSNEGHNSGIFHMMGPSEISQRFLADFYSSYYHGGTFGGGLQLTPKQSGWGIGIDYDYFFCTKEFNDNINFYNCSIRNHSVNANIGYHFKIARLYFLGNITRRLGNHFLYGEASGGIYELIYHYINYAQTRWQFGIMTEASFNLKNGHKLTPSIQIGYIDKSIKEDLTSDLFALLAQEIKSPQIKSHCSLRYTFPLTKIYFWFVQPGFGETYYSNTRHIEWFVSLATGLSF